MAVMLPLALACSGNESTSPDSNALVGNWQVTSFEALGIDFIQEGMSVELRLSAAGTYTFVIANDAFGFCETGTTCTDTGRFSSTSTQITMDAGTEDEITFNYSLRGTTLTLTTDVEGTQLTMVLQRS